MSIPPTTLTTPMIGSRQWLCIILSRSRPVTQLTNLHSETTSIGSSIYRGLMENGRR